MTISTSSFYDRSMSLMARLNDRADTLQTQIATNTRIQSAADDPGGYQQLATLKRDSANADATTTNLNLAKGLLDQTDSTLGSITTQLQRAQELAVQANSGTLSPTDREAIATSIDGILQDVLALANSKDARGQALFGGTADAPAFTQAADGTVSYTGGGTPAAIPIGDGRSIQATESGDTVFGGANGGTDMFAALSSLASAIRSGDSDAIGAAGTAVTASVDGITATRGSVGARAYRVDLELQQQSDAKVARESQRSAIEDVDVTATITELQKTLTILQATQASFTKLSQLSLFNNF